MTKPFTIGNKLRKIAKRSYTKDYNWQGILALVQHNTCPSVTMVYDCD